MHVLGHEKLNWLKESLKITEGRIIERGQLCCSFAAVESASWVGCDLFFTNPLSIESKAERNY